MAQSKRPTEKAEPRRLYALFYGAITGVVALLILSFIVSLIFYFGKFPMSVIRFAGYVIVPMAAFFCGFTATKVAKKQGLVTGLLAGILFLVILYLFSLTSVSSNYDGAMLAVISGLLLLFSTVGGIVSANKSTRR